MAGFLALLGAWYQLRQTRQATAQTRAHYYLQRYDDPQLIAFVEKAHYVIGKKRPVLSMDEAHARGEWWDMLSFRDQFEVQLVLNFWEEMAGMYNRELVDQKLIDEYFGDAALDFWSRSQWLVHHLRAQSPGQALYNEWDEMREDILDKRWRALPWRSLPYPETAQRACMYDPAGRRLRRPEQHDYS